MTSENFIGGLDTLASVCQWLRHTLSNAQCTQRFWDLHSLLARANGQVPSWQDREKGFKSAEPVKPIPAHGTGAWVCV